MADSRLVECYCKNMVCATGLSDCNDTIIAKCSACKNTVCENHYYYYDHNSDTIRMYGVSLCIKCIIENAVVKSLQKTCEEIIGPPEEPIYSVLRRANSIMTKRAK